LSADRRARLDGIANALTALNVSPWRLVLVAALPTMAAMWALLSPDHVLSREMTWDLLFSLAGAWHLHFGHVPHVDFHEPVGQLNFLLTEAGFLFFGPTPRAFLAGVLIVTLAIFAAAYAQKEHFTAEQLLDQARVIDDSVSRATVYRTPCVCPHRPL